ncbi:hypothetical protein GJ744_006848 [Endocarpon pusillum]|uniref:PH-response regulator protein palH/RIM21 n=1 Tax=Endocarpon pusillum TaxID=364733 RepID=A0A8H7ANX1_9EURO|nr:hypothetical protein GJ744_006848 [Endocarpon pusillum]
MSPQLWTRDPTSTSAAPYCSPFTIPPGLFIVNETFEVTLTQNAVFRPVCTGGSSGIVHGGFGDNSTVTDLRTPFYSSTTPQVFAIAVATVISYFLVILIFITPRTFFVGGPGGGPGFLTRRGLTGNSSVVGVGRRPLLQKIAAVTVAISMTIATADTFKVVKSQYEEGFMDSEEMVKQVTESLEIRVVQVISDTFLWLAQVQTLIRLFPRHKEKVTIKWLGFALILLDAIFSSLNNFLVNGTNTRATQSRDAIPALSYLFELAIGFIYASCIIYYSISKYRFAFYHAKMRNICLVALLSITSVLIPVVFFVIDVSSPDIAAWGFYIRWVGAAAASVVVWEWVERIEALERDERKDGILGREVYDGDEMLDVTTANGADWPRKRRLDSNGCDDAESVPGLKERFRAKNRSLRLRTLLHSRIKPSETVAPAADDSEAAPSAAEQNVSRPALPAAVATPVSRAETTSAASTVYAVRYHNLHNPSPQIPEDGPHESMESKQISNESTPGNTVGGKAIERNGTEQETRRMETQLGRNSRPRWTVVSNPFKRKRVSPPAEVAGAQVLDRNSQRRSPAAMVNPEKWNIRSKMDAFTAVQRDKLRSRRQAGKVDDPLPVTIIPAQPRGTRTWSPDDLAKINDATTNVPTHSGVGPSHNPLQLPRDDDPSSVTVVVGAAREWQTSSPEVMHHHQEPLPRGDRYSPVFQGHNDPTGGAMPAFNVAPTGNDLVCEAREPEHIDPPPTITDSSSDDVDGSGHLSTNI